MLAELQHATQSQDIVFWNVGFLQLRLLRDGNGRSEAIGVVAEIDRFIERFFRRKAFQAQCAHTSADSVETSVAALLSVRAKSASYKYV